MLPILLGILGVFLALFALHTYQDHQVFHAIVNIEAQRQGKIPNPQPAPKPEEPAK